MIFALGAGKLFDIHNPGEFEETILGALTWRTRCMVHLESNGWLTEVLL